MIALNSLIAEIKPEISLRNGVAYITIQGCSKLIGISADALAANLVPGRFIDPPLYKILKESGFNVASFHTDGLCDAALGVVLMYYGYMTKEDSHIAKACFLAFMRVGISQWVREICDDKAPTLDGNSKRIESLENQVEQLWKRLDGLSAPH